jgi:fumarate reductase subunit D
MNRVSDAETADSAWKSLYRVGGAAALIMALFIPIQVIIFLVWPPPSTVIGWFTLFQSNRLLGLLDMDLLLIVDQVLMVLVLLALYAALRRASQSWMSIALTAGLVGIAAYLASATAFEMLSLSDQYAAATTDAQRSMYLAAGQAMLAIWQGTAFDVGYILEGVALLIIAVVMLRSTLFGKRTAYVGILLGVMSLVPPTAGTVGLFFALGSLVPLEIWDILIARRLFQLGRLEEEANRN